VPEPSRALTDRELAVLSFMVEHGTPAGVRVDGADRARWHAQLAGTRAGRPCGCGTCPSVELTDADGVTPQADGRRVVLEAQTDEALLLLFVDDDRLSYLELAPLGERTFDAFPEPADLRTD
jgi:hypothetical protein